MLLLWPWTFLGQMQPMAVWVSPESQEPWVGLGFLPCFLWATEDSEFVEQSPQQPNQRPHGGQLTGQPGVQAMKSEGTVSELPSERLRGSGRGCWEHRLLCLSRTW